MSKYNLDKNTILNAKKGEKDALEKVIECNIKLVHKLCQKYKENGIEYDDLVSEGIVGLLKALNNYNPNTNAKFSSYAYPYIKHEIFDLKIKKNFYIKLSERKVRRCMKSENKEDEDVKKFENLKYKNIISLDDTLLEAPDKENTIENIESEIFLEDLFSRSNLNKIEIFILTELYYFQNTFKEVSSSLNLSSKKTRELHKQALNKLKVNLV